MSDVYLYPMMLNQLKTVILLGALSAVLIAVGGALGPTALYTFTALAVVMNLVGYFFSDKIVLAMNRAREVAFEEAPGLHRLVAELARDAGLPKPRIFILPEMQPNAFATGRNPQHAVVAVTEGLMQLLGERELRGVLAHELAHIKNRDILVASVAAMLASAITSIGHALQFSAFFGGAGHHDDEEGSAAGGLLFAVLAPIGATLIQLGISRSREFLADETAARITGDPEGLARALEKLELGAEQVPANVQPAAASLFIVSPFAGMGSVLRLFSTHPPMEERIRRLRSLSLAAERPVRVQAGATSWD
jgi:heat shock protein HtpX